MFLLFCKIILFFFYLQYRYKPNEIVHNEDVQILAPRCVLLYVYIERTVPYFILYVRTSTVSIVIVYVYAHILQYIIIYVP